MPIHTLSNQKSESFGIVLKILSVLAFAVMGGFIKYLDGSIPLTQLVFFRSFIAIIPLVGFIFWSGNFVETLKTRHPKAHFWRCFIGTMAMFATFKVLELLPLAEATALNYLSPIFIVVLAMFWLKESVSYRRWLGVSFGILGLVLMTIPKLNFSAMPTGHTSPLFGVCLGLLAAFLIASAMLQVRILGKLGENAGTVALYFSIASTTIGGALMVNHYVAPAMWQWVCLIVIGLLGGFAQITMTLAFKYSEASALAPFDYLAIVFSVIIGFVAFNEVPDTMFWLAMPLILLGAMVAKNN